MRKQSSQVRICTIALLTAFFVNGVEHAHAHGGRLAADGCHTDRSTGVRHCHRPAGGESQSGGGAAGQPGGSGGQSGGQSGGAAGESGGSGGSSGSGGQSGGSGGSSGSGGASSRFCGAYDRDEWGYRRATFSNNIGFYSAQRCADIDADHVVSLKDAHESGGCAWSRAQKSQFANDRDNLVPSCARINRSKGASLPYVFIRRAQDGRGVDFVFTQERQCQYLALYAFIKKKYQLSFADNRASVLLACGISVQ